jgi:ubiquinone/menaquinone biosynthesis C-methylase UbiE
MDEYTERVRDWLNKRFKMVDKQGVYLAHQPIYGFNKGHCENFGFALLRYVPTYRIMKALSHIKFDTLLDVGGAEGYTAALAHELFNSYVRTSDLSEEACKRATEIYGIDSQQADMQNLPFKDNEYDVVICSEALEHVKDYKKAIGELLRIANNALVITLPHDQKERIEEVIKSQKIHGHIHSFNLDSFSFLKRSGYQVIAKRILSPYTLPILARFTDKKSVVALLISFDEIASTALPQYLGILIVILKKKNCIKRIGRGRISAHRILSFARPEYHLRCR